MPNSYYEMEKKRRDRGKERKAAVGKKENGIGV